VPSVTDLPAIEEATGIAYPNITPYTHITAALVAWNEERRLPALLGHLRPHFARIVVGVQKSDDATLEIARTYADEVVEDKHRGFGDATFGPRVLPLVRTKWSFKVDADEWPTTELLLSLSSATGWAEHLERNGVWISFRSSVEGQEYNEQHSHLRLFETRLGWPNSLHSRPPTESVVWDWAIGHIRHDRSMDELVRDYLRYLRIGQGNRSWEDHNRTMIRSACLAGAQARGWDFVKSFEWWPEVHQVVFGKELL